MNTLLDKMNDEETNNATLFKRKAVAFIKNEEVIEIFKKAREIDSAYTVSATTDKYIYYSNHLLARQQEMQVSFIT